MKAITYILFTLLCASFMSCEKDYTCSCREVDTSTGKVTKYWSPQKHTFDNSSDANIWCHGQEVSGFGIEIKCDLK
jgi:hypothetical protein